MFLQNDAPLKSIRTLPLERPIIGSVITMRTATKGMPLIINTGAGKNQPMMVEPTFSVRAVKFRLAVQLAEMMESLHLVLGGTELAVTLKLLLLACNVLAVQDDRLVSEHQ